jgi:hypothetical protein
MNIKIRIGNIGFRPISYIGKPPAYADKRGDFVCYEPCIYYRKLEEYLVDKGYEDRGDTVVSLKPYGHVIDKKLFEMEETCYSIAHLKYDSREGCCDLESVGPRLLGLSKQDEDDFFEVYKLADEKFIKYCKDKENEN